MKYQALVFLFFLGAALAGEPTAASVAEDPPAASVAEDPPAEAVTEDPTAEAVCEGPTSEAVCGEPTVEVVAEDSTAVPTSKQCPEDFALSIYARVWRNDCFIFRTTARKEYDNARKECEEQFGGSLAMPKSLELNDWLTETLLKVYNYEDKVWIGLDDTKDENHFQWADGTAMIQTEYGGFDYFADGNGPREGSLLDFPEFEDCTVLDPQDSGKWHDYRCSSLAFKSREYAFICQLQAV